MNKAKENQTKIVLNFSSSVFLRFAKAEPIVKTIMAIDIKKMCINPKKVNSKFLQASLKLLKKY